MTSSLAQAIATARNASQSISPQTLAQDSIRGYPLGSLSQKDCIITFKPVGLTVFDVLLIAKIVHDYAPLYGLFDNQCYMFARVIFDVIVQRFSINTSANTSTAVPAPSQEVNLPTNANIIAVPSPGPPGRAGRWYGLLILDPIVRATIVSIVMARYDDERPMYNF